MDATVRWKFRPPPRGLAREQLRLCGVAGDGDTCGLGEHCDEAHGEEELREWRTRWGEMHRNDDSKKTYSEHILDELLEKASGVSTRTELEGVLVTCDQETHLQFTARNSATVWNFNIKSDKMMKGVSLLGVEFLENFSICDVAMIKLKGKTSFQSKPEECIISEEEDVASDTNNEDQKRVFSYTLKIKFHANIFGTFKQTIIFDFGERPFLSKTLVVEAAPVSADSELQSIKETILQTSDPWDADPGLDIVQFEPPPPKVHDDEDELSSKYPAPQPSKFKMSAAVAEANLTRENYKERLHQLLFIEEMSQYQAVERLAASVRVQLTLNYLMLGGSVAGPGGVALSTAKYARPGELFGRVDLGAELSEDCAAGRLILSRCSSLLLRFELATSTESKKYKKGRKVKLNRKKIWECLIEDTLKSVVYIRLSSKMVEENKLTPDMKLKAEVQFKLSRMSMIEMHQALDKLVAMWAVYPEVREVPSVPWHPATDTLATATIAGHGLKLNLKQREAVRAITAPLSLALPPVLIIGPYGTGKTFTLGHAVEQLLAVGEAGTRVLLCTHSNSAADLYIKDYLHPSFESGKIVNKKLVRVYYHNRWVQTVHQSVLKYCLIETDPLTSTQRFRVPTFEDVAGADVVVATLSTSRAVARLLEPGHFSHVVLDEAAQALETEAIMPLVLAAAGTRVVLAGDHMQLQPSLTSATARAKRLGVSLLERLYYLYPADWPTKVLLCENYRSNEHIISYTSDMFYQQKLVASGRQPAHTSWHPLTFFTARGEDCQDSASTSFYNNSEVAEIVDRLAELRRNWPEAWGKKEECEIGVLTPYHDQVVRIRAELRKKRLSGVSVERVLNVQGKQYRAVFISTVRTRNTCNKTDDNQMATLDFGFLSSGKLLNTAITRAQSLVAVVGDPVALVSVGKCRKLWESFLNICEDKKSFHGFTQKQLKSHLEAIELKKIYGLNPLAPAFVPALPSGDPRPPPPPLSAPRLPMAHLPGLPLPPVPLFPPGLLPPPPWPHPALLPYYPQYPPLLAPLPQLSLPPQQGAPLHQVPPPPLDRLVFPPLPPPGPQLAAEASLLPSSVSLAQMRADPVLAAAWFKHLQAAGLNAEAFRQLLMGEAKEVPSASAPLHPGETHQLSSANCFKDVSASAARSPDSGCVSTSSPAPATSSTETDVIQSLFGDMSPLSAVGGGETVPLYLRGAAARQRQGAEQGAGQLPAEPDKLMPLSSLEPRVAALSIHQPSDTPGPASWSSHPPAAPAAPAAPAGAQQTYAGVLRSPVPRPGCSSEPDPLIRIRNLGTRGSHLQF